MTDNRNTILAVILSGLVLIAWQYFYNVPQMERQRAQTQTQTELAKPTPQTAPGSATPGSTTPAPGSAPSATTPSGQPGAAQPVISRDAAIAGTPRIKIETPRVSGSISLKGARIDDLSLTQFRDTVDPNSPAIVLFSPSGTAHPYYSEFGWVGAAGSTARLPDRDTVWQQEGSGTLSPSPQLQPNRTPNNRDGPCPKARTARSRANWDRRCRGTASATGRRCARP